LANSLESLLAEGVISEIYGRLKSGKEAEVFAVCYADEVVAAKVYKDRAQRSFKSNSAYKEGRAVRNTRSQRAMDRGSKFGQETAEDAWKAEEATALYKLHAAGVRVPKPVMFLEGVLFMELVRGADGQAAPRLIDTQIDPEQARAGYLDMLAQLVRILSCDLIHGDLSPYNVLWAESGPTIIDFPQIVSAAQNSQSEAFFIRDARNILGHFAAIDPSLRGRFNSDPREIWRAYVRRELSPDFLPSGRPPPAEPRPRFVDRDRGAAPDRGGQPRVHDRGPQSNHGPQPNRGAVQGRVPEQRAAAQDRGAAQGRGPQDRAAQANRGPQDRAAQANRGPQDRGAQANRGPQDRGAQGNRGPQDRGAQGNRGPQDRAAQANRGPQDRGAQGNRGPQQRGAAQDRGPQLQMASARANIASRSREAPRRPQRGPEVIVLTRREPSGERGERREPVVPSTSHTTPHSDTGHDPARRRRR
jgi:RIO kinase 1